MTIEGTDGVLAPAAGFDSRAFQTVGYQTCACLAAVPESHFGSPPDLSSVIPD